MANQLAREINEQELLLAIIKILSDGWVSPVHFDRLLKKLEIPEGAPAIYFLTGVQQVIRELPLKVFQDEHSRAAILDAAQTALDNTIFDNPKIMSALTWRSALAHADLAQ
jgi:type III secretion system TyeA family effector delivery regulator